MTNFRQAPPSPDGTTASNSHNSTGNIGIRNKRGSGMMIAVDDGDGSGVHPVIQAARRNRITGWTGIAVAASATFALAFLHQKFQLWMLLFTLVLAITVAVFVALLQQLKAQAAMLASQQRRLEAQSGEVKRKIEDLELNNKELAEAMTAETAARIEVVRHAAERERALALLDSAILSAPFGFAFLDLTLHTVRANATFARMQGIPLAGVEGLSLRQMVPPHLADDAEEYSKRVIVTGKPVLDIHASNSSNQPEERSLEMILNFYPVCTSTGEVLGAAIVAIDVTERSLLEAQMRQAQKLEAVGRIASGVAHDFNNLLTVIRSYCDLVLLDMPADGSSREELGEIRSAADRAAALARQLLSFSRKQVVVPRPMILNEIVTSMESMLARVLPAEVALIVRLDQNLGTIKADTGQIEQVILNLAINAADAMRTGGTLTIITENATLELEHSGLHGGVVPGEYILLTVSDSGTGMDKSTLSHIFEPFFTTKPVGVGTGLGLSTVYGIVNQHGGHVLVESEPGAGTTFSIYFPRVSEPVAAVVPAAVMPNTTAPTPTETVLIVEDEPAVRSTLSRILTRLRYAVLEAGHGGEAMRISAEHAGPIDLVISDVMMPEMSGKEFIDRFSVARPRCRVLFMSGYTDDEVMRKGLVSGMHSFIEKPFTVEQITAKVRDVLTSR